MTHRDRYLKRLLEIYVGLPHTAARRPSANDRRLAEQLFDRGISIDLLELAFRLAIARRSLRQHHDPPLPPIRSLAYFLPLLDELLLQPLPPAYCAYLRARTDHLVQIPTDSGER